MRSGSDLREDLVADLRHRGLVGGLDQIVDDLLDPTGNLTCPLRRQRAPLPILLRGPIGAVLSLFVLECASFFAVTTLYRHTAGDFTLPFPSPAPQPAGPNPG